MNRIKSAAQYIAAITVMFVMMIDWEELIF